MTTFGTGNLPAMRGNLKAALANVEHDLIGGLTILKFAKGDWTYGTDETEVDPASKWIVDPYSFEHGFIAWASGRPAGDVMAPMTEPLPNPGPAPEESLEVDEHGKKGRGWQRQSGFRLKCIEGPDVGVIARFSSSSEGGRRAIKALTRAIYEQLEEDEVNYCPVVHCKTGSYQHSNKEIGKVKFPEFDIIRFDPEPTADVEDLEGTLAPEDDAPFDVEEEQAPPVKMHKGDVEDQAPPAPAQTERRRRRR